MHQSAAIGCVRVKGLQVNGNRVAGVLLSPMGFSDAILLDLIGREMRECGVVGLHRTLLNRLKTVQKEERDTSQYDQYHNTPPLLAREQKYNLPILHLILPLNV